jgi:hypothetical protein
LASLVRPGSHLLSSVAGAEDAQQGLLSTVMITRMPAAVASPTSRSVKASAWLEILPAPSGSSTDHGTATRTTAAWSDLAAAISLSAARGVELLSRPGTFTPPNGAASAFRAEARVLASLAGPSQAGSARPTVSTVSTVVSLSRRLVMSHLNRWAQAKVAVGCASTVSPTWIWTQFAIVVFVLIGMIIAITKLA